MSKLTSPRFYEDVYFKNDPDDFKMPYKISSKFDKEVMLYKYQRLSNKSHGLVVRLAKW